MIIAIERRAALAIVPVLLALLVVSPGPARAADPAQPTLTPAEERALSDDLLFCTSLLNVVSKAPKLDGAERRRWEDERALAFMLAATWRTRCSAITEAPARWCGRPRSRGPRPLPPSTSSPRSWPRAASPSACSRACGSTRDAEW